MKKNGFSGLTQTIYYNGEDITEFAVWSVFKLFESHMTDNEEFSITLSSSDFKLAMTEKTDREKLAERN